MKKVFNILSSVVLPCRARTKDIEPPTSEIHILIATTKKDNFATNPSIIETLDGVNSCEGSIRKIALFDIFGIHNLILLQIRVENKIKTTLLGSHKNYIVSRAENR